MLTDLTKAQRVEIEECHPEGLCECYCDNTHEQNHTVCMFCFYANPKPKR